MPDAIHYHLEGQCETDCWDEDGALIIDDDNQIRDQLAMLCATCHRRINDHEPVTHTGDGPIHARCEERDR